MAKVRIVGKEEWAEFVNNCPETTFFHTPHWYEVWEKAAGYRSEARLITFESKRQAFLPMVYKAALKGLSRGYHSSPGGTYGGLITSTQLSVKEKQVLIDLLSQLPSILLRFGPEASLKDLLPKQASEDGFTQIVHLDKASSYSQWSKNHQRCLQKGLSMDYRIEAADNLTVWKDYYRVYENSLDRWGKKSTSHCDWEFFEQLFQIPRKNRRLWLHYHEDTLTAGCLCFYHNDRVVYWHGAAHADFFGYYPNHLLHYHIMKHARENGFKSYDFNPSGGHKGVVRFKKGFGAKQISAPVYFNQTKTVKLAYQFIDQIKKWC